MVWLRRKKTLQFFNKLLKIPGLTFPYDENFPAGEAEFFEIAFVTFNISPAFILPEFCVCGRRDPAKTAVVHMPRSSFFWKIQNACVLGKTS